MTTPTYHQVQQGSDEWRELRRGLITASEMCLLMTPTLKVADNPKSRSHLNELLAQRISGHVEPSYCSDDMERGHIDEDEYRRVYTDHTGREVDAIGFVTNIIAGHKVGCSPDGLVNATTEGESLLLGGMIEGKSRRQKFQIETILSRTVPIEYMLQVQSGMLVCEREWCDFISYSGGLPMFILRVRPDEKMRGAIRLTIQDAEQKLADMLGRYETEVRENGYPETERKANQDGEIQVSEEE